MKPTAVADGLSALACLKQAHEDGRPFDLVLTDCMMPEMDGFELAERINCNPCMVTSTIIMLTSAGERGDGAKCMKLGIAAYLLKPVKQSELFFAIAKVLQKPITKPAQLSLITRHSVRESKRGSIYCLPRTTSSIRNWLPKFLRKWATPYLLPQTEDRSWRP